MNPTPDRDADAAARRRAVDPLRSVIVQAPAGSGKTSLLVERLLRLLARVDEPEQVVAITFTRKAAAEMRERVVRAIAAAAEPPPDDAPEHVRELHALAGCVRERSAARGWNLEQQATRLRIQTIDSFNHWLARHLPLSAPLGPALDIVDDATPLYLDAARATVAALETDASIAADLEALARLLNWDPREVTTQIAGMLGRRELWLPRLLHARAADGLRAASEALLESIAADALEHIRAALPDLPGRRLFAAVAEALARTPQDNPLAPLAGLSSWPAPGIGELEAWYATARLVLTEKASVRETLNIRNGFDKALKDAKQAALAALDAFGSDAVAVAALSRVRQLPVLRYTDEEWRAVEALCAVLLRAAAELQAVCSARGQADHAAVAAAAREALGDEDAPSDLALALDYRIQHLLVDEFQDTSAAQQQLLERLVAEWQPDDGRTLFCVGDPMQSIYGFREADVGLFLAAQRRGVGSLALQAEVLGANFRSSAAVLSWVNETFARLLPARDDFERGAVRYTPCLAMHAAAAGDGVHVHPLVDTDDDAAAEHIARLIESLRAERGGAERSIAVLVRSRAALPPLTRALTQAGVAFRGLELETLADRLAVRDLLSLARALLHGGDRVAWLAVLRAPWCGLGLPDLEVIAAAATETIWQALHEDAVVQALSGDGQARILRLRAVLAAARDDAGRRSLGDWVQSAWLALDGPATVIDAADLDSAATCFECLDRVERECDGPPEASLLEAALARLYAAPSGGGVPGAVEIMTIHRAKGLEYDVVILPDLNRRPRHEEQRLLYWHVLGSESGRRDLLLAPRGSGATPPDKSAGMPLHAWMRGLERARADFESGRLAYVAATRARRQLHLVATLETRRGRDGAVGLAKPASRSLLALFWPMVASDFETAFRALERRVLDAAEGPPLRRTGERLRLQRVGAPPPPLPDVSAGRFAASHGPPPGARPEFDWATEIASRIGTLLHAELHRIARGDLTLAAARGAGRGRYWREALGASGVPAEALEEAVRRVRDALEATAADPFGRSLLGNDWIESSSELALTSIDAGRVVSVKIDRTCVDREGVRWIIDWKSSRHEGADLEGFLASEMERYGPQLTLYSRLLARLDGRPQRLGLYFPLLGRWVERPRDGEGAAG
jgi:ATP-dependent helicase/nuclease subunit A